MIDVIKKTRYPEIGYRQDAPGLWRFYDQRTGNAIGEHYKSKAELLADLSNYAASSFGYLTASEFNAEVRLGTAAPVLLDILQNLMEYWNNGTAVQPGALIVQEARIEIAKATGEETI